MPKQTKLVVMAAGEEKQLLAIREASDGSLIFQFKELSSSFGSGAVKQFKEMHITAHTAKQGEHGIGYKIKYSASTFDGDIYDSSVIVTDKKKRGLIWPVTNSLLSPLSFSKFTERKDDETVRLFGYIGLEESLCYTIYVHALCIELPRVQRYSHYQIRFDKLAVTIYFSFLHLSNYITQLNLSHVMGPVRLNNELMGEQIGPQARMTERGVEKYMHEKTHEMAQMYCGIANGHPDVIANPALTKNLAATSFGRWPALNDQIHNEYGLLSRQKSTIFISPKTIDGRTKPAGYVQPLGMIATIMNKPKTDKI